MANPNFTGEYSTNQIYRDQDMSRCLTDDLDVIEQDIQNLSLDKAPTNHTHTGYADDDHEHTGYAAAAHAHGQADIEGLIAALAGKAAATHDHTLSQIVGLVVALATKADLVDGKVPASQLPSYVSDIVNGTLVNTTTFNNAAGTAVTPEADKLYNDTTTNKSYRWSGTQFVVLNEGVALGETAATAYRGDRGKTAYDHSQDGTVHVTAAQKTAWDAKAAADHNHASAYIAKTLQFTSDTGDVKENLSGQDVLAAIKAKAAGFYTFYTDSSTTNNPKATTGWRYLVHKTGANYAWVLAFGSEGSIYANYLHGGNWVGWDVIYDAAPAALWSGAKVMTSSETITPSKPLSKCRNGWIVEWSDYNNDSASAANTNFVQTPIFKRNVNGAWSGKNMMFCVPNYLSDDGATVSNATKQLIVHDTKLVGHVANDKNTANLDVCIRAVYEF